jgi:hypothetical protein
MSSTVFANGMGVSGKATDNKSIAAMPDVCLSPPSPPAGPIPIPYPNTSMASDTTGGSRSVKINGKEAGLKNASTYSTSTGDEPATQSFGSNVGSHKIKGALKFSAWSFDVKFEAKNAIRLGDLTTHNHSNPPGVLPVTASVAPAFFEPSPDNCKEMAQNNKDVRNQMRHSRKKTVRQVGSGRTTITHARFSPAAGSSLSPMSLRACSRAIVMKFKGGGFLKGRRTAGIKGGTSTICGKPFKYSGGRPKTSHTESRIIESILRMPPGAASGAMRGTLTMAIDWNKKPDPSQDPCPDCHRLICAASACMEIKLCKKGKPVDPKCKNT